MAPSWREAIIVVMHKDGKDPTKLLNIALWILTAILARHVNKIITEIIHPDQTGFIKGRYYGDNIRRLLNLMTRPNVKGVNVTSLDAIRAFDRVSWLYLIQTLKRSNLVRTS